MANILEETVTQVNHWSKRTFSFRTTRSQSFRFEAGEFAMIGLKSNNKNILRAYSIVSAPWEEELEFYSIKLDDGELTSQLQHIKPGDKIIMQSKCVGSLRNESLTLGNTLWLLSTGTGIAPFMSLTRDLDTLDRWDKIVLVHSARNRNELAYHTELSTNFNDSDLHELVNKKLSYCPTVTGEGDERITKQIESGSLIINPQTDRVMICGNTQFNKDVIAWCKQNNMKQGTLRTPGDFIFETAFIER